MATEADCGAGRPTGALQPWVKFLLLDLDQVRKALLPFFPDKTHALMITRLDGNMSIERRARPPTQGRGDRTSSSRTRRRSPRVRRSC